MAKYQGNNFVAKHAHKVNKAQVHTDRKKASKKGYQKHKKHLKNHNLQGAFFCLFLSSLVLWIERRK